MQPPHSAHLLVGCLGPGLVALDNQKKLKGRRHRKPAKGTIGRSSRTSFRTVSLPWRPLSRGSPTQSQARAVPPSPPRNILLAKFARVHTGNFFGIDLWRCGSHQNRVHTHQVLWWLKRLEESHKINETIVFTLISLPRVPKTSSQGEGVCA